MGGISGILSTVALLGFLAFLAGVGLVVVSASQGRPVRGGILLAGAGLIFGVILSVVSQGIIVVQPQERAVVFNTLSGELGDPRSAGTHIIIPILQDATIYNITQQEYTMSGATGEGSRSGDDAVRGRTSDGQEIIIDISILYSVSPVGNDVNIVHERLQNRYEENFIRPTARGTAREVISNFTAEEVYGEARATLEQQMQDRISDLMAEQGLQLLDLLVRDITFSEEFAQSIEQALVAQQVAERARRQVDQIEAEADQARAEAIGLRDARIARAEGEAQAIILEAQAQAEALRLVSEQIAANPLLIQYEYIQQLSDNVSLALVPSNTPFLFDFASLPEGLEGFTPPPIPEAQDIVPSTDEPDDTGADSGNGG